MNKNQVQSQFEAIRFMHQRQQEKREDYIDTYANDIWACDCDACTRKQRLAVLEACK